MRKNRNVVFGVILLVVVGLCLLPSSAFSTSTVLNKFTDVAGNILYGNFGTVSLDVKPGEADFGFAINNENGMFVFSTSLTLYPENFQGDSIWDPSGGPLSGEITVFGLDYYLMLPFTIINPNIISEDQFGFYYRLKESYVYPVPVGYYNWGWATNTSEIPEPSTLLLIGSGLIGLAGYGRKKFFKK